MTTTVTDFSRRIVEIQGAATETAKRLDEGQKSRPQQHPEPFSVRRPGVKYRPGNGSARAATDAYGANARIMSAVREMMDTLMRI